MPESFNHTPERPNQLNGRSLEEIRDQILKEKNYILSICKKFLLEKSGMKYMDTAEGLADEAIARAYDRAAKYKGEAALQTWLVRIAINIINSFLRKKRNEPGESNLSIDGVNDEGFSSFQLEDSNLNPEAYLIKKEQKQILSDGMSELSSRQREALNLWLEREGDPQEIAAEKMGVSMSAFRSLVSAAKQKLAKYVESRNRKMG